MTEKRYKKKFQIVKPPQCRACMPRDNNGDGGRCLLEVGHSGMHRVGDRSEYLEFDDKGAEWLHPNVNGKDFHIQELRARVAELEKERNALKCCGNCTHIADGNTYHSCSRNVVFGCRTSPAFDAERAKILNQKIGNHWKKRGQK